MARSTNFTAYSFFLFLSSFFLPRLLSEHAEAEAFSLLDRPTFSFSFDGFQKDTTFDAEFQLLGGADVGDSVVRMRPNSNSTTAVLLHRNPVDFGRKPSFSTDFSFSGGNDVAFLIAPANVPNESFTRNPLGLSPGVFAVEFDTRSNDPDLNHVGIDIGSSVETFCVISPITLKNVSGGEKKLHSWIDFDGELKILEVRLNNSGQSRPSEPHVSCPIDLSGLIWQDAMFVGIAVSESSSSSRVSKVYSWSLRLKHALPYLMHSDPLDPVQYMSKGRKNPEQQKPIEESADHHVPMLLMALAFGAAVAFVVLLMWYSALDNRRPISPVDHHHQPRQVEFGYEKIVVVRGGLGDRGNKPPPS